MENPAPNLSSDTPSSLALAALNPKPAAEPTPQPEAAATSAKAAEEKPRPPAAGDEKFTKDDVARMVKEGIEESRKTEQKVRESENTRERFIRDKMSDLPLVVQDLLPKNADIKELAVAADGIRRQFQEWFQSNLTRLGMKHDMGGNVTGGVSASNFNSLKPTAKQTPTQLVASALSNSTPVRAPAKN